MPTQHLVLDPLPVPRFEGSRAAVADDRLIDQVNRGGSEQRCIAENLQLHRCRQWDSTGQVSKELMFDPLIQAPLASLPARNQRADPKATRHVSLWLWRSCMWFEQDVDGVTVRVCEKCRTVTMSYHFRQRGQVRDKEPYT